MIVDGKIIWDTVPTLRKSDQMPRSLYDTCLQGITLVVVIKTNIQYKTMKTATKKNINQTLTC